MSELQKYHCYCSDPHTQDAYPADQWCLDNGAERMPNGSIVLNEFGLEVPAEFASIIGGVK